MFSYRLDEQTELRLLEERHAAALLALIERNRARHPEIPQLHTLEEAQDYIKRDLALWTENKGLGAGIWLRGELAGGIRYHEIDWQNRSTELGYWLGEEFEGQGLVTRSCRVMIERAFAELGLNRIVLCCTPDNLKSRAVAERLGFTQEGLLRQSDWLNDRFVDQVLYGLLAREWRNTEDSNRDGQDGQDKNNLKSRI